MAGGGWVSPFPPGGGPANPSRTRQRVLLSVYRTGSLLVGAGHILLGNAPFLLVSTAFLLPGMAAYSVLMVVLTIRLRGRHAGLFLVVDSLISLSAVTSTGGLYSPFLLYGLMPVLSSSLVFDRRVTIAVSAASVLSVAGGYLLFSPPGDKLNALAAGYFVVYSGAVCLAAVLPYVVNDYLRRQLLYEDTLRERQRLSRELHDGVVQSVTALCWQAQALRRRLSQAETELPELRELEVAAERARRESRECLELLRDYTGDGSLVPHLTAYLEHLRRDCGIDFTMEADIDGARLDAATEVELLRICQKVLANVRQHASARNVSLCIARADGGMRVVITDDGCGFDASGFYEGTASFRGSGLRVIHERAESVGGQCRIISIRGVGTEVTVDVPAKWRLHPKRKAKLII